MGESVYGAPSLCVQVNPTERGGENPFGQTPFCLVNPDGDINKKRKRISGGEEDGRVSNDIEENNFKMIQNEDWAKVFCGTNIIHIIEWNNNGCLMCPH